MKPNALIIGVLPVLALTGFSVHAATETVDGITWRYTVSNGKASIGGGSIFSPATETNLLGAISIPSQLGGLPVCSIGNGAFCEYYDLTSITIPHSVTSIGDSAFLRCSKLSVVSLGPNVLSIGDYTFDDCTKLTSISLPDNLTAIGAYAFRNNGLTSITIPQQTKTIGQAAFWCCRDLAYLAIPNGVSIDKDAFAGVDHVTTLKIPGEFDIASNDFFYLEHVEITEGSTYIADNAFNEKFYLKSVTIPNSVTSIGNNSFNWCQNLTSITIPDSVTNIGTAAFSHCNNLTSLTIPDGVTRIGDSTFCGCYGLASITIGSGVTSIGDSAFEGCCELTGISIPNGVTSIGDSAFEGCCELTGISIPNGVTSIGDAGFDNCYRLMSITIPDSVTNIGCSVFSRCDDLMSLRLPLRFKGNTSGMDIPSGCRVTYHGFCDLSVFSAFGDPEPESGVHTIEVVTPTTVSCFANETNVLVSSGIRAVCTGWTGTGSVPASGTGTRVTFSIEKDSSITWNWRKENRIKVFVTSGGDCSFGERWIEDGTTATATITPNMHLYDISISGDTNGVTIVGTTLSIPSDHPRNITVAVEEVPVSLDIETAHGTPTPTEQTEWSWGDEVSASVIADEPENGVRYVCNGWTGTGSAPSSGTGPNVTFSIKEDSSITWNWRKENQIKVSATGGSCDFGEQWVADGTTTSATISPAWTLHTIALAGDTNGVSLSGTSLTIPSDGPREIQVTVTERKLSFDVSTEHGTASPAVGREWFSYGTSIRATIEEPAPVDDIRYVCTGWTGTGSAASYGTGKSRTFTITQDSTLTWNWRKDNRIVVSATGAASCSFGAQWLEDGTTATAAFVPSSSIYSTRLSGDTDGVTLDGTQLAIPSDKPRSVVVHVVSAETAAVIADGKAVAWNATGTDWRPVEEEGASGGLCLRSGEIGAGGRSTLSATVSGEGTLSFAWMISAGRGDFCRFYVDGFETNSIQRSTGWKTAEVLLGSGTHELKWVYERGSGDATGEDAAFLDDIDWRPDVKLWVYSDFGIPNPVEGSHVLRYGDEIFASVTEPEPAGGVRHVCTGWSGTGSTASYGTGKIKTFTITQDSTLTWKWRTDYWIGLAEEGPVSTDFSEDWLAAGSTQTVHWTTTAPYFAAEVSGDTNGVILDTEAQTLAIPANGPRAVTLSVRRLTLADALDSPAGLRWTTFGPSLWFPQIGTSDDGEDAAQSGSVTNGNDTCVLATAVDGPGAFSWTWRLDSAAGGNAGVDVWLDGEWLGDYAPGAEWSRETLDVSGEGMHEIRFEFWNAGTAATHGDRAFLDRVSWTGAAIPSGTVTVGGTDVPVSWLDENATDFITAAGGDAVRAAEAQAANGENAVWECYVAGLDPSSTTNHFLAQIVVTNGSAAVTWTPDLNEGGTKNERIYTVEGKTNLGDELWGPTNAASRFFRVKVEMPEE